MSLNKSELAWAAGFFDGEGHTRRKTGKGRTNGTAELQVAQKTTGCLERFQKAVGGLGKIYGPYRKPPQNGIYYFTICKTSDVDTALTSLWPYLSEPKRKQAELAGFTFGTIRLPKTGHPKVEIKTRPKCHPDRKHIGNGLCGSCYQMAWRKKKYEKA